VFWIGAVMALCGLAPLRAAAAEPGPTLFVADSLIPQHEPLPADTVYAREPSQILTVGRDSAQAARQAESDPRLRPTFQQPRWVMMRSLAVPGWGQFHNHAWWKGIAVAAGEVALISGVVHDERLLTDLKREVDAEQAEGDQAGYADAVNRYNTTLENSTAKRWWLGGLLAFSMIDAYIDAHFIGFDYEFDNDRALPAGAPDSGTAKLRVGFSF